MPGISVTTGNRLDLLARALARQVRRPLRSVFSVETIVVQSAGMARWVSLQLAALNGVHCRAAFPFPNAFFDEFCRNLLPEAAETDPYAADMLLFRILGVLSSRIEHSAYQELRSYIHRGPRSLKCFQLAAKIADLFDQYLVFRPDMLTEWEKGAVPSNAGDRWQADMWRQLTKEEASPHRARRLVHLLNAIQSGAVDPSAVPERVSVFGITYLPSFHLRVLEAVSRLTEVHYYFLNPCREYWADIVTEPEAGRIRRRYQKSGLPDSDLHLEKGNRLLASMGAQGRHFLSVVTTMDGRMTEHFTDPSSGGMLAQIQSDILNLRDVDDGGATFGDASGVRDGRRRRRPPALDDSLQFHACHSPLREIEVLYDQLLAMFADDGGLKPEDVIVMTPDIETYAPLVQAVFETPYDERTAIPFTVADKSMLAESQEIQAFNAVLALAESRWEASTVMALLEFDIIRDRFGLTEKGLEVIAHWIRSLNIRWGYDGDSRLRHGAPDFPENTWRAGIDRLLLGLLMPGGGRRFFQGILPCDDIEGADGDLLGRFLHFLESVRAAADAVGRTRPLAAWAPVLGGILDTLFSAADAYERTLQRLRQMLDRLADIADHLPVDLPIDAASMRYYIRRYFCSRSFGTGFLAGGLTVCAMLPMRSIPFKVICLIGMNMDCFPRKDIVQRFDLMARAPRSGDRSVRRDDRYLFLESLVSAQKCLYISYVGMDEKDNSRLTPSVLVSELIDYAAERFGVPPAALVTQHRLQGFSRAYYRSGNARLFSYSEENYRAAGALETNTPPAPFVDTDMSIPTGGVVDATALTRFFQHPAKCFLQAHFSLSLEIGETGFDDREHFRLQGLERYKADEILFNAVMNGERSADQLPVLKAKGMLPHGRMGALAFQNMAQAVDRFAAQMVCCGVESRSDAMELELAVGDVTLVGRLPDAGQEGVRRCRYANLKARDVIGLWLHHLMVCCAAANRRPRSLLMGKDRTVTLAPVQRSCDELAKLLRIYHAGLQRPLRFFPGASYAFAEKRLKGKSPSRAHAAAKAQWTSDYFGRGEGRDPYVQRCFGETDPLNSDFENLALQIVAPLLAHLNERKTEA